MDSKEREDYLLGQVMALSCAVKALMATHPHPEQARALFIAEVEATEGHALPMPVRESFLQGLEKVLTFLA